MDNYSLLVVLCSLAMLTSVTQACEEQTRMRHVMIVKSESFAQRQTGGDEPKIRFIAGTFDLSLDTYCRVDYDNPAVFIDEHGQVHLVPVIEATRIRFSEIKLPALDDHMRVFLDVPANLDGDVYTGTTNPCNDPFYSLGGSCFSTATTTTEGTLCESGITIHGNQFGYGLSATSYTVVGVFDGDHDSLPDAYENTFAFLDPFNVPDAGQGCDGDRLSNLRDYQLGTDPADSDDFPRFLKALPAILPILLG